MTEMLTTYQTAITLAALLVVAVHLQSFLSAMFKIVLGKQAPGVSAAGDYTDRTFRIYRTHMNSVENLTIFIAALIFAMIAGVNASLVNWLVIIHVVARLAFWAVYYPGLGALAGGLRTIVFVIGFTASMVLAITALFAVL
ncbi:MAG: MAPEG family protein [Rhizobiales bacterium]|nr:MAPEG family protein [Hyphomicrobiales bacterium]